MLAFEALISNIPWIISHAYDFFTFRAQGKHLHDHRLWVVGEFDSYVYSV